MRRIALVSSLALLALAACGSDAINRTSSTDGASASATTLAAASGTATTTADASGETTTSLDPGFVDGLDGLAPGDEVIVLTGLHRARRDVLRVHPRDDRSNPERGVFTTRSAERPNPIGLHEVTVAVIDGPRVLVRGLEAIDGTPVIDLKPVLRRP